LSEAATLVHVPQECAPRNRTNTRTRLVRAGRKLFFNGQFQESSVEQVARAAGFTRAAFYLHFTSKDDLLAAIMRIEGELPIPLFRWFDTRPRDAESIESFIRNYLAVSRTYRLREFHIAALQSPAAGEAYLHNRARLTTVLGESFPAFRPPADDSPGELARAARVTGWMILLEQLSVKGLGDTGPALYEAMILDLKAQLLRLDADYPG